jgi:hypothetical protein
VRRKIEEQSKLPGRRCIRARRLVATIAMLAAVSPIAMISKNAEAQEIGNGPTADGSEINLIDRMRDIETTVEARVYLAPPITDRGIKGMPMGCPYVTKDPPRIKSLIEILRNGELKAVAPTEPGWIGMTPQIIELHKSYGYIISFFFSPKDSIGKVRGYVDYPFFTPSSRTFLTAKAQLSEDLTTWALDVGLSIPGDIPTETAQRVRSECKFYSHAKGRE